MLDRDYRDIVAGSGLAAFGASASIYAFSHYAMGSVHRMGPAMVPVSLGIILAVFGIAMTVPALFRKGSSVEFRVRPFIVLSVAILAFALLIETAGLLPAVFATVLIATFAESTVPLHKGVLLAASMAVLTWAIFILGLGLPISAIDWPF